MENITTYKLESWPFEGYTLINDLIDFDGPLLIHYMKEDRHALFYWIDGNEKHNTWLCFDLKLSDLYDYLYMNISLKELILKKQHEVFFLVDIDSKFEMHNYRMIYGYLIPTQYIPDTESYYTDDVSISYKKLFETLNPDDYLELLRRRSVDLMIKPNNSEYRDTVSVEEAGDFLLQLNKSYKSFGAYQFFNQYKDKIANPEVFAKTTKTILGEIQPRITNAKQSSFCVSLATDIVAGKENNEYYDFKTSIAELYEKEILTVNLNDEKDIEKINTTYDEYTRKQIFEPLIKIINHPRYNLTFIDKKENSTKAFAKVDYANKQRIVTKTIKQEPPKELKKVLLTLTLELNENTDLSTISKKEIAEGTLFAKYSDNAEQEIEKLEGEKFTVYFINPITISYKINEDGQYQVLFDPLEISVTNPSRNNAFDQFLTQFINIIELNYITSKPKDKKIKEYLEKIISQIVEIES